MEQRLEYVKQQIDHLLAQKDFVTVAIDGQCTSGKTTLAAQLAAIYDCNVFHMDDFFLRPEQRTAARFAEVGGNVDYERFYREVLLPLQERQPFSYRPFDCGTFALGDPVCVSSFSARSSHCPSVISILLGPNFAILIISHKFCFLKSYHEKQTGLLRIQSVVSMLVACSRGANYMP